MREIRMLFDEAGAGNVAWRGGCDAFAVTERAETTGNTNFGLNWRASPDPTNDEMVNDERLSRWSVSLGHGASDQLRT